MENRYMFRGKRVDTGEWVKGGIASDPGGKYITQWNSFGLGFIDSIEVDPQTIGQCTGLTASKSYRGDSEDERLIFEGDILQVSNRKEFTGPVYWDEAQWFGATDYLAVAVSLGVEIIGTIHDID